MKSQKAIISFKDYCGKSSNTLGQNAKPWGRNRDQSDKNDYIQNLPNRKTNFNGQAPDSFNVQLLKNSIKNLTEAERKTITGSVQICAKNGHKIKTIQGDYKNIKITTENDLAIANTILKMEQ